MSILVRFTPANLTTENYQESVRRLEEAGLWPHPDGLEIHVLFGSEGKPACQRNLGLPGTVRRVWRAADAHPD